MRADCCRRWPGAAPTAAAGALWRSWLRSSSAAAPGAQAVAADDTAQRFEPAMVPAARRLVPPVHCAAASGGDLGV